jgi:hypothetical protein
MSGIFYLNDPGILSAINNELAAGVQMSSVPNYNPYLDKHLICAKRFNPKMSKEVTIMLNEY